MPPRMPPPNYHTENEMGQKRPHRNYNRISKPKWTLKKRLGLTCVQARAALRRVSSSSLMRRFRYAVIKSPLSSSGMAPTYLRGSVVDEKTR